jgi:hypothetical protein
MEKDLSKKFVLFAKQITMGYLASKVINPFRKCDLYLDLKEKVQFEFTPKDLKDVIVSTLNIIESDGTQEFSGLLTKGSLFHAHEVARKLGFYLGDILYENYLIKGSSDFRKFFSYLTDANCSYHTFTNHLRELLPSKDYPDHKKRLF